jgi:hypothetical protein
VEHPIFPLRFSLLITAAATAFACFGIGNTLSPAVAQDLEAVPIQLEKAHGGVPGPIEGPAAQAIQYGPLSNDPAQLARRKALAAQKFGIAPSPEAAKPVTTSLTAAPQVLLRKKGVFDPTSAPPNDPTGAIGTKRYVELVNSQIGIYDTSLNLINQDTLDNLFGTAGAHNFSGQVIWDAATRRFYYVGDAVFSSSDNELAVGFSQTASPSNATTDWCHYQ